MHSNDTIKNVSWPHFSWVTLYFVKMKKANCQLTDQEKSSWPETILSNVTYDNVNNRCNNALVITR